MRKHTYRVVMEAYTMVIIVIEIPSINPIVAMIFPLTPIQMSSTLIVMSVMFPCLSLSILCKNVVIHNQVTDGIHRIKEQIVY